MSALEAVVAVALVAWLATVSVGILLCVRQLAIVTKRLDVIGGPPSAGEAGLAVGMPVPAAVEPLLAEKENGALVLLMSATCGPCRVVAEELGQNGLETAVVVLMPGPDDAVAEIASLLPVAIDLIRDPQASELAGALQISLTPFAVAVREGWIVGKSYVNRVEDMRRLAHAMAEVDIDERELIHGGRR